MNMDRKGRPPNLQLQERSKSFEPQPKTFKGGIMFRGQKGKEWKAVSHSVSILFNGKLVIFQMYFDLFTLVLNKMEIYLAVW